MSKEVYLPVAITFGDDGLVKQAVVDFEGAPWPFVDSENNVWTHEDEHDPDSEYAWVRDEGTENDAIIWISQILDELDYDDELEPAGS